MYFCTWYAVTLPIISNMFFNTYNWLASADPFWLTIEVILLLHLTIIIIIKSEIWILGHFHGLGHEFVLYAVCFALHLSTLVTFQQRFYEWKMLILRFWWIKNFSKGINVDFIRYCCCFKSLIRKQIRNRVLHEMGKCGVNSYRTECMQIGKSMLIPRLRIPSLKFMTSSGLIMITYYKYFLASLTAKCICLCLKGVFLICKYVCTVLQYRLPVPILTNVTCRRTIASLRVGDNE